MLNFRITSIAFIIVVGAVILLHVLIDISLWWLLLPILIYKVFLIYGSAVIQSGFFLKAHCNSNTLVKHIAITFDDGPDKKNTPRVLAVLAEYNVSASFFVIGKNIQGNESIVKAINAAGHTIGNHTFSHSFLIDLKGKLGFMYELNTTSDLVFQIIGKRMRLFRPPYGVTTPHLATAVKALKYDVIGWSIRSMDTTNDGENVIFDRVKAQVKPGGIILFHDTSDKTVQVLKQTLNFARDNGFKIVSVEELLNIKAYEL